MPPLVRCTAPELLESAGCFWQALLHRIAQVAQQQDCSIWLVGGVVRDLILGGSITRDLDLAVEGDAIALAQALVQTLQGRMSASHEAFGTATVILDVVATDGQPVVVTLDLVSTRIEQYLHPAALPVIQLATIAQDLHRRDFTINALGLSVPATSQDIAAALLLDPFDGQHDLAAGVLRVLHNQSFCDDPTRILRGLRLAARLELGFEPHTHSLLTAALAQGLLEATTPDRIRTELCLALEEPYPEKIVKLACELGVMAHLLPSLCWSEAMSERIECARGAGYTVQGMEGAIQGVGALLVAGLLTYELTMEERADLIARYRLPNDAARLLREVGMVQSILPKLQQPGLCNSELDKLLRSYGILALNVVRYAESGYISGIITHYVTELRTMIPLLDGYALQRLGITPGPKLGALLTGLRAARLDGLVTTQADEELWVHQQLEAERSE